MKGKMPYGEGFALAYALRASLAPYCERLEMAGSLRRRKAEIGDIELVAIPKMMETRLDLFGESRAVVSRLDDVLAEMQYPILKSGSRYKQFGLPQGITCDLFLQPDPATWGVNFTIRTGSADFAQWLVTDRRLGGAKPGFLTIRDALVWHGGEIVPTPEEEDFFRVLGVKWIEPERRTAGAWGKATQRWLVEPALTPSPLPVGEGRKQNR